MTSKRTLTAVLAGAAMLAIAGHSVSTAAQEVADASYVVLASTAPTFIVGALVDDDELLDVPSGATLTLIDVMGAIKVIEGPFFGRLRSDADPEEEPDFLSDLASIIAEVDTDDVGLGMGRSTMAPEVSPWLVEFDAAMPGDLCVSPEGQLVFLRIVPGDPLRVRFASMAGTDEVTVTWPADDAVLRWPDTMPAEDGGRYVIDVGAAPAPPTVTLHMMPHAMDSDAHAAVWLARSGCRAQAEAMICRLALGG